MTSGIRKNWQGSQMINWVRTWRSSRKSWISIRK